jgi:hypothetical protein
MNNSIERIEARKSPGFVINGRVDITEYQLEEWFPKLKTFKP